MTESVIKVNRAPVLTLWGAVVAERLGHDRATALTLGRALAGLNAQAKGRSLGIFGQRDPDQPRSGLGEECWVELCGRAVPAKTTESGLRAVVKDQPIDPEAVEKYLAGKLGDDLPRLRAALSALAAAHTPERLAEVAYSLYESFRPRIPSGRAGWGQAGELDLEQIAAMAQRAQ